MCNGIRGKNSQNVLMRCDEMMFVCKILDQSLHPTFDL